MTRTLFILCQLAVVILLSGCSPTCGILAPYLPLRPGPIRRPDPAPVPSVPTVPPVPTAPTPVPPPPAPTATPGLPVTGNITLSDEDRVEGYVVGAGATAALELLVNDRPVAQTRADVTDIAGNPSTSGGFRFGCLELDRGATVTVRQVGAEGRVIGTARVGTSTDAQRHIRFRDLVENYYPRNWTHLITHKMVRFRMGAACWEKVLKPQAETVRLMGFQMRDLASYLKRVGLGDIAATMNGDEANLPQVEALLQQMCGKFSIECRIDDPACEALSVELGVKYRGYILRFLAETESWRPRMDEVHFIVVTAPGVGRPSLTVSDDGRTIRILAPSEGEPAAADWDAGVTAPCAAPAARI